MSVDVRGRTSTVRSAVPGRGPEALLSIIVPFFNAENASSIVLEKLTGHLTDDIEVLFVDDGSTDGTLRMLEDAARASPRISVIAHDNRGPGGARNSALLRARGRYVWFVDADDDIRLDAVEVLRRDADAGFDFIDFNYDVERGGVVVSQGVDTMHLEPGVYRTPRLEDANPLVAMAKEGRGFGRLWTKVFRRRFLLDRNLLYPEYCVYEDTPLTVIIPNHVSSFKKASRTAYVYRQDEASVTRTAGPGPRLYDRLDTAVYGYREAAAFAVDDEHLRGLQRWFCRIYLLNSIFRYRSTAPLTSLAHTLRVMRAYREVASELGITEHPLSMVPHNARDRAAFQIAWWASRGLPSQLGFFSRRRQASWGTPIRYPA